MQGNAAREAKRNNNIDLGTASDDTQEISDVSDDSDSNTFLVGEGGINFDDDAETDFDALKWTDTALGKFRAAQTGGSVSNTNKNKAALRKAAQGTKITHFELTL